MAQDPAPFGDRNETEAERNDRKWEDVLQELRVVQTGAQLTAGFLLTLPFQQSFDDLTDLQRRAYLALVVLAALVTGLVLTPIAIHRRLAGRHVKGRLVAAGAATVKVVVWALALLVTGITTFIFDVVVDGTAALAAGGVLVLVLVVLLVVVPSRLVD